MSDKLKITEQKIGGNSFEVVAVKIQKVFHVEKHKTYNQEMKAIIKILKENYDNKT